MIKVSQKVRIASVVVFNKKGEVLVLQRSAKSKNNPNKWNFPGGHIDEGETHKEAAIRECQEEAGITPKKVKFLGNYGKMAVFIGETKDKPKINEESDDWKFISEKDIDVLDFTKNVVTVLNKVFNDK
jgi:8-oxo-dGTP diphosphatase